MGNFAVTSFIPDNRITLLQNGETYFPAIESAIDQAVHEIYLESYIFENDAIGQRIAEALRRAALRGVRTHMLIDGFGSKDLPETPEEYNWESLKSRNQIQDPAKRCKIIRY